VIFKVFLSNKAETYRPPALPEGRKFLAKPSGSFKNVAILDTERAKKWNWPDTDLQGGWAPFRAFSSYTPVIELSGVAKDWQWPILLG